LKNLKTILIIVAVLAVIGGAIGAYLFFKPVAQTADISPSFNISAEDFGMEFQENNKAANEKYSNKVVQLTGTVNEIETDAAGNVSVIMNADSSVIQFSFSGKATEQAKKIQEGDSKIIKGKYTGFLEDDLFGGLIIKMNECVLVEDGSDAASEI
jgi:flagellar basal body-associated protein FliL